MASTLVIGANGATGRCFRAVFGDANMHYVDACAGPVALAASNLRDPQSVRHLLLRRPRYIYNFAGSFTNDFDTDFAANVELSRHICEATYELNLNTRILLVGSAAEYGNVAPADNPISELYPLKPVSIYGLTKTWQTCMMHYYVAHRQLDIVMVRPFNLLARDMSERLFIGKLYRQIDAYKAGQISKIELGNLTSRRDYFPIEEAVRAYASVMMHGTRGEIYNVASGRSIPLQDLLCDILHANGLTMDSVRSRPDGRIDVPDIYADRRKLDDLLATADGAALRKPPNERI